MECVSDEKLPFTFGETKHFKVEGYAVIMSVANDLLVFETESDLQHLNICVWHQTPCGMRICYDNRLTFHEGRSTLCLKIEPDDACLLTLKNT